MVSRTFVGLMLVTAVVAGGCFGGDDGEPTDPVNGDAPIMLTVTIDAYTANTTVGGMINVTWSVSSDANGSIAIDHTAIHWANFSVSTVDNTTGPGVYGNNSGVTSGEVPGTFETSFTVDGPGAVYLRAHAMLDDENFWSQEVSVDVVNGTAPLGTVHTIEIGTLGVAHLADYDPEDLTIKVGDAIKWSNVDAVAPHTATSDADAPEAFNTGNLSPGSESEAIQFLTPGTYDYHCTVHPQTMSASFTVEA